MENIFRIIKSREKYITDSKVVSNKIFQIQEFCRGCFGLGRKKWRNYMASSYSGMSPVWFYNIKEAQGYLKCLLEYHDGS
ncbi:MAG: hypothetical protein QQN41_00165 [Nitrosopumilus sp.]